MINPLYEAFKNSVADCVFGENQKNQAEQNRHAQNRLPQKMLPGKSRAETERKPVDIQKDSDVLKSRDRKMNRLKKKK